MVFRAHSRPYITYDRLVHCKFFWYVAKLSFLTLGLAEVFPRTITDSRSQYSYKFYDAQYKDRSQTTGPSSPRYFFALKKFIYPKVVTPPCRLMISRYIEVWPLISISKYGLLLHLLVGYYPASASTM